MVGLVTTLTGFDTGQGPLQIVGMVILVLHLHLDLIAIIIFPATQNEQKIQIFTKSRAFEKLVLVLLQQSLKAGFNTIYIHVRAFNVDDNSILLQKKRNLLIFRRSQEKDPFSLFLLHNFQAKKRGRSFHHKVGSFCSQQTLTRKWS